MIYGEGDLDRRQRARRPPSRPTCPPRRMMRMAACPARAPPGGNCRPPSLLGVSCGESTLPSSGASRSPAYRRLGAGEARAEKCVASAQIIRFRRFPVACQVFGSSVTQHRGPFGMRPGSVRTLASDGGVIQLAWGPRDRFVKRSLNGHAVRCVAGGRRRLRRLGGVRDRGQCAEGLSAVVSNGE